MIFTNSGDELFWPLMESRLADAPQNDVASPDVVEIGIFRTPGWMLMGGFQMSDIRNVWPPGAPAWRVGSCIGRRDTMAFRS